MPECAFHKGVETNVSCPDCGRYICPKDMVDTPVGYKCRECGLMRPKRGGVKPKQVALGAAASLGAGLLLALVLVFVPFFSFWLAILGGIGVGEATRRGAGGHRTWHFVALAALGAFTGVAIALVLGASNLFALVLAPIAAGVYVSSARY